MKEIHEAYRKMAEEKDCDYDDDEKMTKKKKKKGDIVNNGTSSKGDSKTETEVEESVGFIGRYLKSLKEETKEKCDTVKGDHPAKKQPASKVVKQDMEKSATEDKSKLDKIEAPDSVDAEHAIDYNDKKEEESAQDATNHSKPGVNEASAYRKMLENRAEHYRGATSPQRMDDNWSGKTKAFADIHQVATPDEADINSVVQKNRTEVVKSLQRKSPMRHNDQDVRIESVEYTNESFNHFMSHSGMHASGSHATFKGSDGKHHVIHAKERNTAKGGKVITINGKEHSREEAAKKVGNQKLNPRAGHPDF